MDASGWSNKLAPRGSRRTLRQLVLLALLLAVSAAVSGVVVSAHAADDELWRSIAGGGHVLLIRHAATEAGTGDPPGFRLDDCRTQRNLSAAGRAEARRLGEAFRARRVPVTEVRSSPWCRCLETARLAFGGASAWPALSSLYNDSRDEEGRRREVLAYVGSVMGGGEPGGKRRGNLVLVTHNFNIRSLVGVSPRQAEVIVTRFESGEPGGALRLVGRIQPPAISAALGAAVE